LRHWPFRISHQPLARCHFPPGDPQFRPDGSYDYSAVHRRSRQVESPLSRVTRHRMPGYTVEGGGQAEPVFRPVGKTLASLVTSKNFRDFALTNRRR
jgi:hypothetical protein